MRRDLVLSISTIDSMDWTDISGGEVNVNCSAGHAGMKMATKYLRTVVV